MNLRSANRRRPFPARILSRLRDSRMLGIRAGTQPHRFTGIWFVLVDERVFVRPWNDKPGGWRRAFLREPRGTIAVSDREVAVRARRVAGQRLLDAIDSAYARKYDTKASEKWVRGFSMTRRRKTTTELLPS
jgi:hypothetical protein